MRGAVSMALAYNQVKKIEKHSFSVGFFFSLNMFCDDRAFLLVFKHRIS